jgi:hypothetical protein
MKVNKILLFLTILFFQMPPVFSQQVPGIIIGGQKNDYGYSLCLSPDGRYAIAGSTRSFAGGSSDFYFLVLDTGGQIVVEKTYGWQHHDNFRGIIPVESGYCFIGDAWDYGPGGLDIFMLETDKTGESKKGHFYGTMKRDNGFDILQTEDGGFLILGHSRLENPKGDIYLLKIDENGDEQWHKSFWDEGGNDYAFQIIKSGDDNGYVFVGSKFGFFDDVHGDFQTHDADILLIKTDLQGNRIWKKTYGKSEHDFGYGVCNAPDGGYYLIASSQSYGNGSFDMVLIKTDDGGNEEWIKSFGGTGYEYGKALALGDDNGLYLVGTTESFGTDGSTDVFVVKTDLDGNEIWDVAVGGTDNDFGEDIVALPGGGCALVGSTHSFSAQKSDLYFLRLTKDGIVDIFNDTKPAETDRCSFYPNPMRNYGVFTIPVTNGSYTVQLFDINGQKVFENRGVDKKFMFHNNGLGSGTYIYRIFSDEDNALLLNGKLVIY